MRNFHSWFYTLMTVYFGLTWITSPIFGEVTQELTRTNQWIDLVNLQLSHRESFENYRRNVFLVTDHDLISKRIKLTTKDEDEVCVRYKNPKFGNLIQRIAKEQRFFADNDGHKALEKEWKAFFNSDSIELCESVALIELPTLNRYWHVYLIETGRTKRSKRLLLLIETEW